MAPRTTRDHVRRQSATQAVHEHRDKLLKRADKKTNWKEMFGGGITAKDNKRILAWGFFLSLGAMAAYVIMIVLWFRLFHFSFDLTVLGFLGLLTVGIVMAVASSRKPWLFWLGVLFAFSAVVGCFVGFILYFQSLAYYWRYQGLRSYTNVAAAQRVDAFTDAGMFLWTEDTRLDAMRAVGYRSKFNGQIYCVAPIVDGTMGGSAPTNYFAVGENCCNARASFTCDDAADGQVRSALVLLEPEDVVPGFMLWAARNSVYPRFERAIHLQASTYSTTPAGVLKLVKWVRDPIQAKNAFYDEAVTVCIWTSCIYYFFLFLACCFVAIKRIVCVEVKRAGAFRQKGDDVGAAIPDEATDSPDVIIT